MLIQDCSKSIRHPSATRLSTLLAVIACLLVLGVGSQLWAQVTTTKTSVNFGSVAVGAATGNSQALSFTVPSGITLATVSALTLGAPNLDFTITGGTCAEGATNATCTVQVQFLPKFAGTRLGGVVLTGQGGAPLITVPVYGTGVGPQMIFLPGTQTNLGFSGWLAGVAVDGSGNLYLVGTAAVYKETLQADGSYKHSTIGSGFHGSRGRCGGREWERLCF
jgi:hypothetical protein